MKIILGLMVVGLAACAPRHRDGANSPAPAPQEKGYTALSTEELFKSKFKSVEAKCDVYLSDKEMISTDEKPSGSISLAVYPQPQETPAQILKIQSEAKVILEVSFETPTLSSEDVLKDGKVVGQTALIEIQARRSLRAQDMVASNDFKAAISAEASKSSQELPMTVNFGVGEAITKATHEIRCQVIAEPIEKN